MVKTRLEKVPINKIKKLDNSRLRIDLKSITSLMEDMKNRGLLQPIGVVEIGNEFIIKYGNRRLECAEKLGWKNIDAIVYEEKIEENEFMSDNIAENYHREGLTVIELAEQCRKFKEAGYSISEISVLLTIPVKTIRNAIGIQESVPETFKKTIDYMKGKNQKSDRKGKLPASVASEILHHSNSLTNENKELLLRKAREEEYSGSQIRLIKNLVRDGAKLEEAINQLKNYKLCSVELPLKIEELNKYKDITFAELIRKFIRGDLEPNKRLLIK